MAETPASPVPESSPGVPATTSATAPEPTGPLEPAAASEPAAAPVTAAVPDPVVAPEPVAAPEPPAALEPPAEPGPPVPVTIDAAPAPDVPQTWDVSPTPDIQLAAEVPPVPAAMEALAAMDPGEPRIATTLDVPPLPDAGRAGSSVGSEGGEWDLLVGKVEAWLEQADLRGQWDRLSGPLRGFGLLLGLLVVLKLYVALLDTLDDLLLLPRLLQLVGLIALVRFSVNRLTRSTDRQLVLDDWKRRWDAFRGS